jgi:hypothetical protein
VRDARGNIIGNAYYDENHQPVYGPGGFHRLARPYGDAKSQTHYFDVQNKEIPDVGAASIEVPYVANIDSVHTVAARAGLRSGDILWRFGRWSLPDILGTVEQAGPTGGPPVSYYEKHGQAETASVKITVIRGNMPVTLTAPPPGKDFALGIRIARRLVPLHVYDSWKKEFG